MAVTPQTNEAFLREVDEELRREQAATLWRRYGRLLIGAIIAGLAAFGGYLYWQNEQLKAAGAQGEQVSALFQTLGSGNVAAAQKPLAELAVSNRAGYKATALLLQGDVALQKNDLKGAARIFGSIADDASLPVPFRDLARIRQTSAELDTLKPEQVIARLKPLAVKGGPWLGSAGEMMAVAYIQMNRPDLAGRLYADIAQDESQPQSLRTRAVQMAGTLGTDAIRDKQGKTTQ